MNAKQQSALVELSRSALSGTDQAALRSQAATLVAQACGVEYAAIWELLPDESAVVLTAGTGWEGDAVGHATIDMVSTYPAAHVLRGTSEAIVIDWLTEKALNQPLLLREHGMISSLAVPIYGQARCIGFVGADSISCRTFTDEEIRFLQVLANVLGMACENARLVSAARDKAVLEERQRLARDLHDSVTQALYSVTLHAEAATRLLASGDASTVPTVASHLQEIQETAQEALDEMRVLVFELRPPALEQVGLVAALQARLDAVEGRVNLETRFITHGVRDLPAKVEQGLYRIAQEALNNALKHAHARSIAMHLWQEGSLVTLEIEDDGVGYHQVAAKESGGLGLRGLEERVTHLGGRLSVCTAPGAGTQLRIEVEVPL